MPRTAAVSVPLRVPEARTVLELLKPVTWFAPMWAFMCGIVSSGRPVSGHWPVIVAGVLIAGPLVCGASQAVNDWFDRHVDAINEPKRPIPSGRMPGRWGLYVACGWTGLSLLVGTRLGVWGFAATVFALILAWVYSAPPARLKLNGWWGNAAVGLCYEGVPWFTGAAIMTGRLPHAPVIVLALLYSAGAHGIMTLNDFKSVEGDIATGVRSLPVQLGVLGAARFSCVVMAVPQAVVILLMAAWRHGTAAIIIGVLLLAQFALMRPLLANPRGRAPWYNSTGTTLYVIGMLVAAIAVSWSGG
jgi:chlorophyll synthase